MTLRYASAGSAAAPFATISTQTRSSSTVWFAISAAVKREEASGNGAASVGRTRLSKPTGWPVSSEKIGW